MMRKRRYKSDLSSKEYPLRFIVGIEYGFNLQILCYLHLSLAGQCQRLMPDPFLQYNRLVQHKGPAVLRRLMLRHQKYRDPVKRLEGFLRCGMAFDLLNLLNRFCAYSTLDRKSWSLGFFGALKNSPGSFSSATIPSSMKRTRLATSRANPIS